MGFRLPHIPEIAGYKQVSWRDRTLLIVIRNYSEKKEKYCFASNGHLSKVLNIDIRSIQKSMKSLRNASLIKLNTVDNGGQKQRQIYVSKVFDYENKKENGVQNTHEETHKMYA